MAERAETQRTRVLIVDDDDAIRETIRMALEGEGYAVGEAADGLAAMKLLRAGPGGVVLLDLMMPRLDGASVLRAVAAQRELAIRHAFVMVTASSSAPTPALRDLLAQLTVPLLRKPFELEELLATVARAARRLRSVRAAD